MVGQSSAVSTQAPEHVHLVQAIFPVPPRRAVDMDVQIMAWYLKNG